MKKMLPVVGAAICLCAIALCVGVFVGGPEHPDRLDSKARRQWKDNAIAQIARQASNSAAVFEEIKAMTNTPAESDWDTWLSGDLIVMTNGEWMAYRYICQKEEGRIPDLFLGLGSDGRWYYSTFHFCVGMMNLKDEEVVGQPESLADFRRRCHLREFDGHSDECLRSTMHGE